MTDPLPTECKDLAFARNLIRQMKGEGGRHNSTASPARVSGTPAGGVVVAQEPVAPMAQPQSDFPSHHYLRFLQQEIERGTPFGVIDEFHQIAMRRRFDEFSEALVPFNSLAITGRWGRSFIMRSADDCEIGDACRYVAIAAPEAQNTVRLNNAELDVEMTFKKRGISVTPDNGQTWREEYFWERVE